MAVEQDGAYLDQAEQAIATALGDFTTIDRAVAESRAGKIIAKLHASGWALVSESDYEKLMGAYTLQEVRGGRFTSVPLPDSGRDAPGTGPPR